MNFGKRWITMDNKYNNHYIFKNNVNVIDIIYEAIDELPSNDAFDLGNALKYLLRCNKKGKFLEDITKAKVYIDLVYERYNNEKTEIK